MKQDEDAAGDAERRAVGAEGEGAEQAEADIDGGERDAERREELENGRGQEGDPEHRHGARPETVGRPVEAATVAPSAFSRRISAPAFSHSSSMTLSVPVSAMCRSLASRAA